MEFETIFKKELEKIDDVELKKKRLKFMLNYIRKSKKAVEKKIGKIDEKKKEIFNNILENTKQRFPSQLLKMKVKDIKGGFDDLIKFQILFAQTPKSDQITAASENEINKKLNYYALKETEKVKKNYFNGKKQKPKFKKIIGSKCSKSLR